MKKFTAALLTAVTAVSGISASAVSAAPSPWAQEEVEKAGRAGLIEDRAYPWRQETTREEFCIFAYDMLNVLGKLPAGEVEDVFADTDDERIMAIAALGVVEGRGDGTFDPDGTITREEAAAMLCRIAAYLEIPHHEVYYDFSDAGEISAWAEESVQTAANLGVMTGVGENAFDPQGSYTTEQSIATMVRLFDIAKDDDTAYMTFADKLNYYMPEDRNYTFSPFSVKLSLLMAANGAAGDTRAEIIDALNIAGEAGLEKYNDTVRIMLDNYAYSELLKLNVANSLWINTDRTDKRFSEEYSGNMRAVMDAETGEVTDATVGDINKWVKEATGGRIAEIVSGDSDFWAMLVNAVYFRGRWQSEFNPNSTEPGIFTDRNGREQTVDFMNRTGWMQTGEIDGVRVARLPYAMDAGNAARMPVSMYLLMADGEYDPEEILLSDDGLENAFVEFAMPKFRVEYETELGDTLKKMGIEQAFGMSADFSPMFSGGKMNITDVLHKTYIDVDEEGTEAAAVTAVGMAGSSLPPEPVEIKYNKPFTFVIKDDTNGEILFMGEYAYVE